MVVVVVVLPLCSPDSGCAQVHGMKARMAHRISGIFFNDAASAVAPRMPNVLSLRFSLCSFLHDGHAMARQPVRVA